MADTYLGESRSAVMLGCIWPFAAINLLSLFPRLYARIAHRNGFGLDDPITIASNVRACWCCNACTVGALTYRKTSSLAHSIVCTYGASNGLGRHLEFVKQSEQHNLQDARLAKLIACDLGIAACALGKTSYAVTQWTRSATKSKMRAALFCVVALMDLANLLDAIFVFAHCRDPRHLWIPSIHTTCWFEPKAFVGYSIAVGGKEPLKTSRRVSMLTLAKVFSGFVDISLALNAWFLIRQLNMGKHQKRTLHLSMSICALWVTNRVLKHPALTDRHLLALAFQHLSKATS